MNSVFPHRKNVNVETLGARLKRIRKQKNLDQVSLAKSSGVSQATISDIERGRNSETKCIAKIAVALGVSSDYLATGEDFRSDIDGLLGCHGHATESDYSDGFLKTDWQADEEFLASEMLGQGIPCAKVSEHTALDDCFKLASDQWFVPHLVCEMHRRRVYVWFSENDIGPLAALLQKAIPQLLVVQRCEVGTLATLVKKRFASLDEPAIVWQQQISKF